MAKQDQWRNRIIGLEYHKPTDLLDHPYQWRVHPKRQEEALLAIFREVGIAGAGLIYASPRAGGALVKIDGHKRAHLGAAHDVEEMPWIRLDVTDAEADKILATFDPISAMATADAAKLDELLRDVSTGEAALQEMLADLAKEAGLDGKNERYSRKIEAPTYTPSNVKPAVSELYDDSRTRALVAEIEATEGLTDEDRRFLTIAAQRHTVLRFNRIADYYAHADESLQTLMENNALVIIDFKRAIELGFVQLTQKIAEQVKDEYGE